MNNIIEYFYKIKPQNIKKTNTSYIFEHNKEKYHFEIYERNEKIENIISLLTELNNNILMSEIVKNKDDQYITIVENIPYYLYKININENIPLKLSEISYLSYNKINYDKRIIRENWNKLWEKKIDYTERQIQEMGKKYPLIVESFNYYIGLTENAISYIKNTIAEETPTIADVPILSHRKINNNLSIVELYNPTNIILDHKSRDVAEYIKKSFINDNKNIYKEITEYLKIHYFSPYGIRMLMGRLMYPSHYYEIYDKILQEELNEKELIKIIKKNEEYEELLKNLFQHFQKTHNIPIPEWLEIKKVINQD